jgi:hypothetical protein
VTNQVADLAEREATLLRLLHEPDSVDTGAVILPEAARRSNGARQQAQLFVVAKRVTADATGCRQFPYAQRRRCLHCACNHRAANVPYFSGVGGVTPPGGNAGAPGSMLPGWTPDLRRTETRVTAALMVKL